MKTPGYFLLLLILIVGCRSNKKEDAIRESESEFTIAFGSCNRHDVVNVLWDDILASEPDIWIWGGDIIYADTDNPEEIEAMYTAQDQVEGYSTLKDSIPIMGTWDDHDYGLNDGGSEFAAKQGSQKALLDFLEVPENSPRRKREGVYAVHDFEVEDIQIRVLILDTRYFRSSLTPDTTTTKRYQPNTYGEGTVLGTDQWKWLEEQLRNSKATFNILVSSIQFLSAEHGFETWGNFPHEVDRLKSLIVDSQAKGVILLSGDRHISEFSKTEMVNLDYPLVDFTSSGLTHVYDSYSGEPNPFRVGEVVFTKSFGLVTLNTSTHTAQFKMLGDGGAVLGEFIQTY